MFDVAGCNLSLAKTVSPTAYIKKGANFCRRLLLFILLLQFFGIAIAYHQKRRGCTSPMGLLAWEY